MSTNTYQTDFYKAVVEPVSDDLFYSFFFKRTNTEQDFAPDTDYPKSGAGFKMYEDEKNAHRAAYNYSRRRG